MEVNNSLPSGTILKGISYSYRIEKTLGQGSFGITYLASVKMTGALGAIDANIKVAIKEFFMRDINGRSDTTVTSGNKGGIYDDYKRKFSREAVNLSKLQHPNIIKVIESFEANNTVYFVMEYIGGGSLDDYITMNKGLKEDEAIEIVKQVGSALTFMHNNKMLHLDLKPSNIMRKDSGDVVLIDFGLSKQYDEKGEPESSTKVGAGTPGYAPIEQANYREGKGFPVTMDVYALGATMFKMLTGVRPPEASDILNDGFPLFELQEHGINERVSASIAKAMAPTKKDRYHTIDDFLDSFEEEATIIDVAVSSRKENSKLQTTNQNLYNVLPTTKKVEISYCPTFPIEGIMYDAIVNKDEVQIWSGAQKATLNISREAFSKFLTSLNSLNLNVRKKVNPEYMEASETASKLTITLYDDKNSVYACYWIGGWKNQFGNIIGETLTINEKVKQIIPHLEDFLNSTSGNENKKDDEIKTRSETIKPIHEDLSKGNGYISYRWWAILVLAVEIGFAWLMLTQSRDGDLDSDGKVIRTLFIIASICVFSLLYNVEKEIGAKTWRILSIGFTIACFANSLMLPMWNHSLTGAYFTLSIGLSFISSLTLLIKKSA